MLPDDLPVCGVLGRVHPIWYGEVRRKGITESLVVVEDTLHICMAEKRPVQVVAVRYRTALAHVVVGGNLIVEHWLGSGKPIGLKAFVHGIFHIDTASPDSFDVNDRLPLTTVNNRPQV